MRTTVATWTVTGLSGHLDVVNSNAGVELRDVAGTATVSTSNGPIVARFVDVVGGAPMSFVTSNATIEVALPASVAADVHLETDNGELLSDFAVLARGAIAEERLERRGGASEARPQRLDRRRRSRLSLPHRQQFDPAARRGGEAMNRPIRPLLMALAGLAIALAPSRARADPRTGDPALRRAPREAGARALGRDGSSRCRGRSRSRRRNGLGSRIRSGGTESRSVR